MKFKYKKYKSGIVRPVIRVDIFYKQSEKKQPLSVLIDSGADKSILPAEVGVLIGLDVESGRKERFMGIMGPENTMYIHEIEIAVGGHRVVTEAGFTYALPPQAMGVMGQYGFFNLFVVKFDLLKEEIELKIRK